MNITKRFCDKFEANKEERLNDEKTNFLDLTNAENLLKDIFLNIIFYLSESALFIIFVSRVNYD